MQVPSTDGVTLTVHDLGGSGDPLLLAHATGFCGRAYGPIAAALAGSFHVWALDFRGHGDSTAPAGRDFSWAAMGSDALAAVEAMGNGPLVVMGHSMGGAALLLAELARPGSLRCAYLYEPIIFPSSLAGPMAGAENPLAIAARKRRSTFPSKADALLRYASRTPLGVLRADALAAYVEHGFADQPDGAAALKCAPADEADTFASQPMTVDQIEGLTLPTTVAIGRPVHGMDPASSGPAIIAALTQGRLLERPHLGHFGPLQDPDLVARDVLDVADAAR